MIGWTIKDLELHGFQLWRSQLMAMRNRSDVDETTLALMIGELDVDIAMVIEDIRLPNEVTELLRGRSSL